MIEFCHSQAQETAIFQTTTFKKQSAIVFTAVFLLAASVEAQSDAVVRWNRIATDAAVAAKMDPLTESRVFSILHVAIHDALNTIYRRYEPYRLQAQASREASAEAAIAAASHATLVELMPMQKSQFDASFAEALGAIQNGEAKAAGLEVGRKAAATILAVRKNDGASRTVAREPGKKPGEYRPTPPDSTPAWFAHWAEVTPFVMKSPEQFRPVPPPAVTSARALADMEEVKEIGAEKSVTRTAEQSEIREAGDREWINYLPTPPVPDYPSTHTVLGAAAAAAMEGFFGTDFISFTMTSGAPYPGLTRKFWSFSEAARENGASRVLAGIHFATAVSAGYLQGTQIGVWVADNALRPVKTSNQAPISRMSSESPR
ncbi:MAG: phosphatase PAP2 family protein [bacterium]